MKIYYLIPIALGAGIVTLGSCNKTERDELIDKQTLIQQNALGKINSLYYDLSSFEQAKVIGNDVDWIIFKTVSQELINIMLKHKINLRDDRNFNTEYFYKQLKNDAAIYHAKMVQGRSAAYRLYYRYFSDREICEPCGELTFEKKKAYADLFDQVKSANTKYQPLDYLVAPESDDGGRPFPKAPNCWDLSFFACTGVCAMTIEIPPAFALCMAYCISQHCK